MKRIIYAFAALFLLLATACNKEQKEKKVVINDIEYDVSAKIKRPVAFVGTAGATLLGEAISSRVSQVGSVNDAGIIIIASSELEANKELIRKAWVDGKIIVELYPTVASHSSFWDSFDAPVYIQGEESGNDLVLLAMKGYSCYQLQNPLWEGLFDIKNTDLDDDGVPVTPSDKEELKDNTSLTYNPVEMAETVEYFNTKLNSMVDWMNEMSVVGIVGDSQVPSFDGDLSKRIMDASFSQNIRKTYNVGANNFEICTVALSSADKVTRHSTVDLDMHIVPLYAYQKNQNDTNGDYYFVTMSLVSHNGPLYGLYKEWHGWVRTWAHIFYGKKLAWNATLVKRDGRDFVPLGSEVSFFDTPVPATTSTSSSYTTGFSAALNVAGQAGINAGKPTVTFTVGGNFTWSNSKSTTVPDQSIVMKTDPLTRKVSYEYWCNNEAEEDDTKDALKPIALSDQKCEATWCWRVNSTRDDDDQTYFAIKFELFPEYGYMWRHATWGCEGSKKTKNLLAGDLQTTYITLEMPNRKRNGILELKATANEYIHGLVIYDSEGHIAAKDDGSYEQNTVQRYQLPVGTYNLEYEIREGMGELLGKYRLSNVEVRTAETTVKATLEGEQIE